MSKQAVLSSQQPATSDQRRATSNQTTRQLVNFLCYKMDAAWYRLPRAERRRGGEAFLHVVERWQKELMIFTYSTLGLKTQSDFLLWRIGERPEQFTAMSAECLATSFGAHATVTHSLLSMTKRSTYVDKLDPEHQDQRMRIVPAQAKYLFVYPFVKTREWYGLSHEERQQLMDAHIVVGNKYKSVKLHTTYSFGLDDQEFVVAFETDKPSVFLDLVMELRETKASRYTLRDTPVFTCVRQELPDLLRSLGAL